jgi:cytidylate kinase
MTATPKIRAERRFKELQKKGDTVTFEAVLQNVQERDYLDTNRVDSPLIKAKDALELDNSNSSKEEQFEQVLKWIAVR